MKKLFNPAAFLSSLIITSSLLSCAKASTKVVINSASSKKSHNLGQNCMSCHTSGTEAGNEGGVFRIAGSVYDAAMLNANTNATVYLYTGPNGTGTLKYTLPVDKKGNFYATGGVDLKTALYPVIIGSTSTFHMSSPTKNGACNSCHNVSTDKIWAD